jgi:hypothetical protein
MHHIWISRQCPTIFEEEDEEEKKAAKAAEATEAA